MSLLGRLGSPLPAGRRLHDGARVLLCVHLANHRVVPPGVLRRGTGIVTGHRELASCLRDQRLLLSFRLADEPR